jgi:hypothetical protein
MLDVEREKWGQRRQQKRANERDCVQFAKDRAMEMASAAAAAETFFIFQMQNDNFSLSFLHENSFFIVGVREAFENAWENLLNSL